MLDGIAWRVWDGVSMSFWKDPWVPHHDKLGSLVIKDIHERDRGWKVADRVTPSGE